MRIALIVACSVLLFSCSDGSETKQTAGNIDTDGDGWTDAYEIMIGTNPAAEDPDSDGDGLPDDLERRLGMNEHSEDSDEDGVLDGDEDPDEDHLPSWFELKIGSDPGDDETEDDMPDGLDDQDGDGLVDYLEFDLGTDPFNPDTDGDGISDLDESNDPDLDGTNPDSDGDGLNDGEDQFVTPSGCTDTPSDVYHTFSSCIGGTWHQITVRYYTRTCPGQANVELHEVVEDVDTGQPCDAEPASPPPASELD